MSLAIPLYGVKFLGWMVESIHTHARHTWPPFIFTGLGFTASPTIALPTAHWSTNPWNSMTCLPVPKMHCSFQSAQNLWIVWVIVTWFATNQVWVHVPSSLDGRPHPWGGPAPAGLAWCGKGMRGMLLYDDTFTLFLGIKVDHIVWPLLVNQLIRALQKNISMGFTTIIILTKKSTKVPHYIDHPNQCVLLFGVTKCYKHLMRM